MDGKNLDAVASKLVAGKGILASDESPPTLGKRLIKAGLENDEQTRCAWRSCLYGAKLAANSISGCIVYEEALSQTVPAIYLDDDENETERDDASARVSVPVTSLLERQGVFVGVKADAGLAPFEGESERALPGDTVTRGLERLREACERWSRAGASFTKWRSALKIHKKVKENEGDDDGGGDDDEESFGVSRAAVEANAEQLARYASISQRAGLVPIVEPEIVIDGEHSAEDAARALREVLRAVFSAIEAKNSEKGEGEEGKVRLSGLLLKLMPVVPGADAAGDAPPPSEEQLASMTLDALGECVPREVPGVVLLSGGLSERRATEVLQAINAERRKRREEKTRSGPGDDADDYPWAISFSFGRALQATAMRLWSEGVKGSAAAPSPSPSPLSPSDEGHRKEEAQKKLISAARAAVEASAEANGQAARGEYRGPHPTEGDDSSASSLREGFRGFRDDDVAREAARVEGEKIKKEQEVAVVS